MYIFSQAFCIYIYENEDCSLMSNHDWKGRYKQCTCLNANTLLPCVFVCNLTHYAFAITTTKCKETEINRGIFKHPVQPRRCAQNSAINEHEQWYCGRGSGRVTGPTGMAFLYYLHAQIRHPSRIGAGTGRRVGALDPLTNIDTATNHIGHKPGAVLAKLMICL